MEMVHEFSDKVVSLVSKRAPMIFPALAIIDGYWEGLRRDGQMPAHKDVDPRGLSDALSFAFVLEMIAPGVGRLRVAGTHLNDLMGMEVRGMPFSALFDPSARDTVARVLKDVIDGPQVAELSLASQGSIGQPTLQAGLYLAPLAGEKGHAPRVLGCLQSDGRLGRVPRRFTVAGIETQRKLPAVAKDPAPYGQAASRPKPAQAFAEDAPSFEGKNGQSPTAPPYLRLVKSD